MVLNEFSTRIGLHSFLPPRKIGQKCWGDGGHVGVLGFQWGDSISFPEEIENYVEKTNEQK